MKKMMRRILPIFTLLIPFQAYAAEGERMDRIMLKAILTFLQYASRPIVAVAIGMFIYSITNEDGASKTNAIKIIGLAVFLYSLLPLAKASGLC